MVRNLAQIYRSGGAEVRALRARSLDIMEGAFIVLPGPSDSGKPPLLNIRGGLVTPTSGGAWWRENVAQAAVP